MEKIICQGDPWGSIQCSVQIDTIGKDSLAPDLEPFKYKELVEIPALGMVDDVLAITESGYKTARMNAFFTAKVAIKKNFNWDRKNVLFFTPKKNMKVTKILNWL